MTPDAFKEAVEEAADLYLREYPRSYDIAFDLDDPDSPSAEITLTMHNGSSWFIPIALDESDEPMVEAGEGRYLPLNGEGFYAILWFQAMDRLSEVL